jgi:hypothetical protein
MGEKGNLADVRPTGEPVASAAQPGARDIGLGGQPLLSAAPPPPQGAAGGGLLSDLTDEASDNASDIGFGGREGGLGIVKGRDEDDDESS